MKRTAILILTASAAAGLSIATLAACGPGDGCEVTATCDLGTGGDGGSGTGSPGGSGPGGSGPGGSGGSGGSGGTGGGGSTCGNGTVDAGEVCFGEAIAYPTTKETATSLVVGDCDGDGDLDVVTADRSSITITALKNDGTGTFTEATSSQVTSIPPIDLATAGAGSNMIVVVSYQGGGYTDTFTTPGDCTFTATRWFYHLSSANAATTVTVADLDGTGEEDVVVAINDTVAIGFGGTGTATELSSWTSQPLGLATGDVNDDGLDDIIYADFENNYLRWGVGTGGGLTMSFTGEGTAAGPTAVAAGDLDGDGDDDVVVAHGTANTVAVFKSNGGPSVGFTKVLTDASVSGNSSVPAMAPLAIALGDLDGDGDLDAATANSDDSQGESSVSLLLNDGSGNLTIAPGFPRAVGRRPVDIAIADVNDDGAPDIITAHDYVDQGTSHVNVLLGAP